MKFTNYTSFSHDLCERGLDFAVERSARLGFESVELFTVYPSANDLPHSYDAKELRGKLDAHGLSVACYSIYADLFRGSDEEFKAAMQAHIAFAATVGSPFFHHTVAPHKPTEGDASYGAVLDRVRERVLFVVEAARGAGIVCLYEPQGPYFNGVDGLGGLLSDIAAHGATAAVCGDVGNPLFVDCDPIDIYRAFADRILHVHVKDYLRYDEKVDHSAGQSRAGRWLADCDLGKGIVDLATCFRILKATGYDGRFGLERHTDDAEVLRMMDYVRTLWENA